MRIRIKFRKYGVMRFIGHLDIMRYFQKAIRRAGIDIKYSEGFSPHQIMSFAAPLGVGITSDGEYLDIEVNTTMSTKDAIAALNETMVEGIDIVEYVELRQDAKKAMTAVAAADYFVYYKQEPDFSLPEIRNCIQTYYYDRPVIEIVKQTKKSERTLDLKPLIYQFREMEQDGHTGYFLQLSTGSTDNIKPELVLADLYQYFGREYQPFAMQIHRFETYERVDGALRPLYQAGDTIL